MKGRYIYGKLNSEIQAVEYTGLPGEDGVSIKVDNEERTIEAQVDFNRFNYTPGESTNATLTIDNEDRTIAVSVPSERKTYNEFPQDWNTTIDSQNTIEDFCATIDQDSSALVDMAYLGELNFTSTPFVGNAETLVEIVDEKRSHKTIHIILSSGTTYPYHWEYTYWVLNGVVHTSGWIGFQTQPIVVNNVSPTWVEDSTYTKYEYKGTISISGVKSSMRPEVVFGLTEAVSGIYAPICEAINGGVVIYAKDNASIVIPTIVVYER